MGSETSFSLNILNFESQIKLTEKNNLFEINSPEMKLFIKKNSNSKKIHSYLYLLLILIVLFVLSGVVVLISGIISTNKIRKFFELKYYFNDFISLYYNAQMSLFMNVLIYRENSVDISNYSDQDYYASFRNIGVGMNIPDYFLKELEIKLDLLKIQSDNIENLFYNLNDDSITNLIFKKDVDYFYIINDSSQTPKVLNKKINFFELLSIYQSFARIIYVNPDFTVNVYFIDNSELKFNFKNLFNKNIDIYQNAVYHITINYPNILSIFDNYKRLVDDRFSQLLDNFFYLIIFYFLILLFSHFVLFFVYFLSLRLFNEILCQNICLMESMIMEEKLTFLNNKFKNLKILCELYLKSPYNIIKKLYSQKKKFYGKDNQKLKNENKKKDIKINYYLEDDDLQKKINFEENENSNSIKNNIDLYLKNIQDEKINYIEKSNVMRPFYNFLGVIFISYFLYSNILFFLFYVINRDVVTYNTYSKASRKIIHDINNNALLITTMTLLNQTDYVTTKFLNKDNFSANTFKDFNSLYLLTSLNSIFKSTINTETMEQNGVNKDNFEFYNYENIDCEKIYTEYNDSIFYTVKSRFNKTFPDLTNDLIKMCNYFDFMKDNSLYRIYEELNFINFNIYNNFANCDKTYTKIKGVFDDFKFFDLFTVLIVIVRPIYDHIKTNLIFPLLDSSINNYLVFNIFYLLSNFFIDLLLLYLINKKIIKRLFGLNENFNTLMRCLKI